MRILRQPILTERANLIVAVQLPVPAQTPLLPPNVKPLSTEAVSVALECLPEVRRIVRLMVGPTAQLPTF